MAREKIIALGKKMTDRIPYKLGFEKLTETDPEYYGLECIVSDEEADVARRARNCHTSSRAKNAIVGDYRRATALEGLFGYMKLIGEDARLNELMAVAVRAIDETRRPRG